MSADSEMRQDLPWTGERYVPEIHGEIELEHLHRYALARDLAAGRDVLDIACGEGYGAMLLAGAAKSVIGVDIAEEIVRHAQEKYAGSNLRFAQGSCASIPLEANSIDLVTSFETIEHHDQHEQMLAEIKRVLRPNGVLIISSPDKYHYSEARGYRNEFHVKELYLEEFSKLIGSRFAHFAMYGQRVCYGSVVGPLASAARSAFSSFEGNASRVEQVDGIKAPFYLLAVASDADAPPLRSGLFDGTADFMAEFAAIKSDLADASDQARRLTEEVQALRSEVARIKATYSWRITKPLRFLAYLGRHLRAMLK